MGGNRGLKRYFFKPKAFRRIVEKLPEPLKTNIAESMPKKPSVEVVEEASFKLYLVEGEPLLVEMNGKFFPYLSRVKVLKGLPRVVVDRGAVPHVCNGADVMRPGIVRIEGEFEAGSLVVIVDELHGKPLALGLSLHSSREILKAEKGKMVETIHHVGDKIWNLYRNLKG
ncbi:RNA-binding protein [Candidatus Bathyarchaeota archaeon]|nr:MAG: RNA-binding protein [Candidatus Bathyarchaeota archaeon]